MVEEPRGLGLHGLHHVNHRRQGLDVGSDPLGEIFGEGAGGRHAGRIGLPDIAHLVIGEGGVGAILEGCQLRPGLQHMHIKIGEGEDPGRCVRRLVDGLDAPMGHVRAHEGDVLQARQADVGDERPGALQVAGVLLAQEACANPSIRPMTGHAVSLLFPKHRLSRPVWA